MSRRVDVDLRLRAAAEEALRKIAEVTERETLPYISASRYPQQTQKGFVARVSSSRFRVWKVPSATRRRQNICVPCLQGVVEDVNGGSRLTGRFALHPFNKVIFVLPLAVLLPAWLWAQKTTESVIWLVGFTAIFLFIEFSAVRAAGRLRRHEEGDIREFLYGLFPESRPASPGGQQTHGS